MLSVGSTSLYECSKLGSIAGAAVNVEEPFRSDGGSGKSLVRRRVEQSERARDASDFCRRRELERWRGLARIELLAGDGARE